MKYLQMLCELPIFTKVEMSEPVLEPKTTASQARDSFSFIFEK
jgi:hypothetical protein